MKNYRIREVIFVFVIIFILTSCSKNYPLSTINQSNPIPLKENLTLIFCTKLNKPIKSLPIRITSISNTAIFYDISSDCDGRCDFIDIEKGSYQLEILDSSKQIFSVYYIDQNQVRTQLIPQIFDTSASANESVEYDIYLKD